MRGTKFDHEMATGISRAEMVFSVGIGQGRERERERGRRGRERSLDEKTDKRREEIEGGGSLKRHRLYNKTKRWVSRIQRGEEVVVVVIVDAGGGEIFRLWWEMGDVGKQ